MSEQEAMERQPNAVVRARAIGCALLYGIAPSRMYERERHYACSYWTHLRMNLAIAIRWATWNETSADREFEVSTNGSE